MPPPPPPRLLAGGDHHPPPTSSSSPRTSFSPPRPPPTSPPRTSPSPSPSPSSPTPPHSRAVSSSSSMPPAPASPHSTRPLPPPSHPSPSPSSSPTPAPASELARVAAPGFAPLLVSLLRRVPFPDDARLLELLHEHSSLLASAVFALLRLLAKNRLTPVPRSVECRDCEECKDAKNLEECREKLVSFCVSVLRDSFQVRTLIGRDLVRSLHELVLVPEFQGLWKDLILGRAMADICRIGTPGWCTTLAISPEMETQLLFMMNNVKWGDQKRYQLWFARKHLMVPGGEERIPDIVRFICCGYHPANEIIQSGVIARWAVIGWLLTSCSKSYVQANAKMALFYDWLFFNGKGNVMNIEPAMLLMVNSVSQYTDITNMLLEFLFLLVENYEVRRKEAIAQCVRTAFAVLVKKGVVPSLELLTCCEKLSPLLRQKLVALLSSTSPAETEEACRKAIDEVSKATELNNRVCSN